MATILDSFVMTLELDPSKFTEGQKKAADSIDQLESRLNRLEQRFRGGGGSGGEAGLGAGMVSFFRSIEHPFAAIRQQFEKLTTSTDLPKRGLTDLATQGHRTGDDVEHGALAGAAGMRVLGGTVLAAFAAYELLNKAISATAETTEKVFRAGVGAASANLPVRQLSATANAIYAGGGGTPEETFAAAATWNQQQNQARMGQGPLVGRMAQMVLSGIGVDPLTDTYPEMMAKFAAAAARGEYKNAGEAVTAGGYLGMSQETAQMMYRTGANYPGAVQHEMDRAITDDDTAAALKLTEANRSLGIEFDKVWRTITTELTPGLIALDQWLEKVLKTIDSAIPGYIKDPGLAPSPGEIAMAPLVPGAAVGHWLKRQFDRWTGKGAGEETMPSGTTPNLPAGVPTNGDTRGQIPALRASAIAHGFNPDDVVALARAEGLGTKDYATWDVNNWSYGGLQGHVGGLASEYQKATGKDPSKPENEADLNDWMIGYAAIHGWGKWTSVTSGKVSAPRRVASQPTTTASEAPSNKIEAWGDSIAAGMAAAQHFAELTSQAGYQLRGSAGDRNDPKFAAVWGRNPQQVLSALTSAGENLRGKTIQLSSGMSNVVDPSLHLPLAEAWRQQEAALKLIGQQIDAVTAHGGTPELMGVASGVPNADKVNAALGDIAAAHRAIFGGALIAPPGVVHPTDYGANAAVLARLQAANAAPSAITHNHGDVNTGDINLHLPNATNSHEISLGVGGAIESAAKLVNTSRADHADTGTIQ